MVVDGLYYPEGRDTADTFDFSDEVLRQALLNIYSKDFHPATDIEVNLFNGVWKTMDKAAREGFGSMNGQDPDRDFFEELCRNNGVFAAFKVHRAQNDMARLLLDSDGNLKPFEQWAKEVMPIASHQMRHWLRTEYDTAVIRAHQAADWRQFEREKDILPNLKWMPSTSVHPGADHRAFWGTIRPVDDPFWSQHRPGDRWNCKCDLTSTDEPETPVIDSGKQDKAQDGLENNPVKDGKLFSDNHPYVKEAHSSAKRTVEKMAARIDEMLKEMPEHLTPEEKMAIVRNNIELEKAIGMTKKKPMTYEEADKGKENPDFALDDAHKVNCQTCVPVHLLRRRGFDVEAAPNVRNSAYDLMARQKVAWNKNLFTNHDGSDAEFTWARTWAHDNGIKRMGEKDVKRFLIESMKEDGLYEIYCGWERGNAHVFCAERKNGIIRLFDPQPGVDDATGYIAQMKGLSVGILRIDNKLVNPKVAALFIKHQ